MEYTYNRRKKPDNDWMDAQYQQRMTGADQQDKKPEKPVPQKKPAQAPAQKPQQDPDWWGRFGSSARRDPNGRVTPGNSWSYGKGERPVNPHTYDDELREMYDQIVNREKFGFNANENALLQQLTEETSRMGQLAMRDTMAQGAALTGGYNNSYAQAVGQQQYNEYLHGLNDEMKDIYAMELERYNAEGDEMMREYGMLQDRADRERDDYLHDEESYWRDREYGDRERAQNYDRLMMLIVQGGYKPSDEELERSGMTRQQAEGYLTIYNESNSGGGGGGGGGGRGGYGGLDWDDDNPVPEDSSEKYWNDPESGHWKEKNPDYGKVEPFYGETYGEANAYLEKYGISGADLMTEDEWNSGRAQYLTTGQGGASVSQYESYREYLWDQVSRYMY